MKEENCSLISRSIRDTFGNLQLFATNVNNLQNILDHCPEYCMNLSPPKPTNKLQTNDI